MGTPVFRVPSIEAGQERLNALLHRETLGGMKVRGEADLGVADTVFGQIIDRFECDSLQGFLCLHHARGDAERPKVEGEAFLLAASGEPFVQGFGIGGRKSNPVFACKLDDCFDSDSTVEMVVKLHFGKLFDDCAGQHTV